MSDDGDEVYVDIPLGGDVCLRFASMGGSRTEDGVTKHAIDLIFMTVFGEDEHGAAHFTMPTAYARRIAQKILFMVDMIEGLDDKPPHHFDHG